MIIINYSNRFLKSYRKFAKNNKKIEAAYEKFLRKFVYDQFYPSLDSHLVNLSFGKFFSSSITKDLRVIWNYIDENNVIFIDTGVHSGGNSIYK
jgi:mRNA-degrading endonuclease YafQ of YafQ-DinJ toxin-antitoxin module